MKTIIAGSRSIIQYNILLNAVEKSTFTISTVISGRAKGPDQLSERYARENNIKIELFPAEWKKLGLKAGYIRNEQMAMVGECLIAIWDGISKGTKHMIDIAYRLGLKVYIHKVSPLTDEIIKKLHQRISYRNGIYGLWDETNKICVEECVNYDDIIATASNYYYKVLDKN